MKLYNVTPAQITAWVTKHFPDCKPRKDGAELVICNPLNDDDGYHLNISTTKGTCHDWRSDDWAGPVSRRTGHRNCSFINFVRLFLNCSFYQAIAAISAASGDAVAFTKAVGLVEAPEPAEKPLVALPPGSEPVWKSSQSTMATLANNWLASRGVSQKLARTANIHHVGADVVFPYYEYDVLVYWQQRSAINKKFLFPDAERFGVTKGQFIYNFDNIEPASYFILTESIFGCYTLGEQCGATGGADMTEHQLRKIKLLGPKDGVVLAPDNDLAAIKSILRNGDMLLRAGFPVSYSIPPRVPYMDNGARRTTKDWNELYTKLHWPLEKIRDQFEGGIVPLNKSTRLTLGEIMSIGKRT